VSGRYRVEIDDEAERQLAKLPRPVQSRLKGKILTLTDTPRPSGSTKLAGRDDLYRIRVGDYRAVYAVRGDVRLVIVVRFAHRSKVYQRLPNKA
jgi:mRNA interferase RelE/StbE